MSPGNGKARIDALKERERELRAMIAAEQVRLARRKEKETARLCSVIGAALIHNAAQHPDFELMLKGILQTATTISDGDKKLLRSRGYL